MKKKIIVLLMLMMMNSIFANENKTSRIYIYTDLDSYKVELYGHDKELFEKIIDEYRDKNTEFRKIRCKYQIIYIKGESSFFYKTDGLYLALSGTDKYIKVGEEIKDIINNLYYNLK